MASEPEVSAEEIQSFLERVISSRNRDLSLFLPFLLGFPGSDPSQTQSNSTDPVHNSADGQQRERIVLINPLTQGMVVIEGTGLDSLFRVVQSNKDGPPPASKSAIEAMLRVEIREGEEERECVICLEECGGPGGVVKEMPCKHRFHGGCIEKWLGIHGSCPVCRFNMPVEEEDGVKKGEEERDERREIWVSFLFGRGRRRMEEVEGVEERESSVNDDSNDSGNENQED